MNITQGIDPFQNITIASACNTMFRTRFLKPNTIYRPHSYTGVYRSRDRHSLIAIKLLKWISYETGLYIQHAQNGGEHRIGNYRVDGFDRDTNTVYEFLGDLYGTDARSVINAGMSSFRVLQKTVQDVYDNTMYRLNAHCENRDT